MVVCGYLFGEIVIVYVVGVLLFEGVIVMVYYCGLYMFVGFEVVDCILGVMMVVGLLVVELKVELGVYVDWFIIVVINSFFSVMVLGDLDIVMELKEKLFVWKVFVWKLKVE